MWEVRQQVDRPIRTRTIVGICPTGSTETKMLERADWDYAVERWRFRRSCWNVHCGAKWSLLSVAAPSV